MRNRKFRLIGGALVIVAVGLLGLRAAYHFEWFPFHNLLVYGSSDVFTHGNPSVKTIALTFDDGPHPNVTPHLLRILRQYQVHATFFVVGEMAARHPGIIRQTMADGHTIGNHTAHHPQLRKMSKEQITAEWQECSQILARITGTAPSFCRPPHGRSNRRIVMSAKSVGLKIVCWSYAPNDMSPRASASVIALRLLKHARNGDIFLLHDGSQATLDALPDIITGLRKRGFELVTIAEMARE